VEAAEATPEAAVAGDETPAAEPIEPASSEPAPVEPAAELAGETTAAALTDTATPQDEGVEAAGEAWAEPANEVVAATTEPSAPSPETIESVGEPTDGAAPEEPAFIEVWRPGRATRPEGPRHPRPRRRQAGRKEFGRTSHQPEAAGILTAAPSKGAAPSPATDQAEPAPAAAPAAESHQRHHRRRPKDHRQERPRREQERPPSYTARPERREKAPDPNSPFAKLAALKAQLEADAKERR
jgi:ATP-dependent RNA helicase SUPV3L1/SUV3